MKRRKILVFIPLLGLFLSGCTFQEGFATAKSWIGTNIYHPVKDFFEGLIGKKDEEKKEEGEDTPQPQPGPTEATPVEITAVSAPASIEQGQTLANSSVSLTVKYSDDTSKTHNATKITLDTSKVEDNVKGTAYYNDLSKEFTINVVAPAPEEITSIADVYAAAIEGSEESFTFQGVVTGTQGNSFYLQEEGHGMLVYNYEVEGLEVGKVVKVKATVKSYKGLAETDKVESGVVVGDGTLPTPLAVAGLSDIGDANVLASVSEATFVSKDADWTSSHATLAVFLIGSDQITVKFDKFGYDADKAAILNAAIDGQKFELSNIFTAINDSSKQLGFAGTSTIKEIKETKEIASFGEVTGLPESVEAGEKVSNSSVSIAVTYTDESVGSVHPTSIVFENSEPAENVPVQIYYNETLVPGTYTINVIPSSVVYTPLADVYAAGVAAGTSESAETYTFKGVVTATQGNSFYIQDGEHGMYVYNKAVSGIAVAKEVKLVSTVTSYNGSPQTKTVSEATILGEKAVPSPVSITGLSSIGDAHILANAQNAVFKSKDKEWTSSAASLAVFTIGSDDITVKFDKYGFDSTKAALLNAAQDGDVFDLTNIVTAVNNTTKQLGFAGTSTIQKVEKQIASFGEVTGPASIKEGTLPSLEDINIAVTYSDDTPGSVHPTGLVEFDNVTSGEVEVSVKYGEDVVGSFVLEVIAKGDTVQAWTKSTSVEVGDTVVMACAAKNQYLTGISTTSTKYGLGTTMPSPFEEASYTLTVVSGLSTGTVAFKTSDNKYLTWLSGNSLNVSSDLDANSSWNLTYSTAGNAQIVNSVQDESKDRQIWWNDSATRFACYTDKTESSTGYSPIQLYTLQTVEEVAVSSIAFDAESYEVEEGQKISVTAHVNSDATNQNIVYSLASTTLATINAETGELTTTGHGTVTVTATSAENGEFNVSINVTITEKVVPVVDGTYTLLTDPSVLTAGDKIIIANSEKTYGLKAYDSGNNCKAGAIVDTSGELTDIGEACELVLEDAGSGRFYLKSGDLYLYAASSSGNQLKGKSSKDDDNGVWEITVSGDDMEITAYGSSNRNLMRFNPNSGTPIFSCYSSTPKDGSLCKVYRLVK